MLIKDLKSVEFETASAKEIEERLVDENLVARLAEGLGGRERRLLVSDLDEVLVMACHKVIRLAYSDGNEEAKALFLPSDFVAREKYHLFSDPTTFGKYYGKGHYDTLIPTKLGQGLSDMLAEANPLLDLAIISHHDEKNPESRESKEQFVKRWWPQAKLFIVDTGIPKSETILKEGLSNWTTFIDDRIDIVADVVLNTMSIGKEVMLPRFGYNGLDKLSDEVLAEFERRNVSVKYYDL